MKILYITAEGFDTPNPNNQMAEVMIRDFLDNGHTVHLVQSHRKGINEDIPASLENRDGFSCDTVIRNVVDKTRFLKRYFNDTLYAFKSIKYWKKVKDADVIYLQSNPTIIFLMVLLKILKRNVPIVYSIYDVFPGHAFDIGVIRSKLIFNILQLIQKPCYYLPAAITVLSEDMKIKVVEQGAKEKKVFVVPAWFDIQSTREVPKEDNKFIEKYNIDKSKFYVQYAGSIGYVFNYKTVIELAQRLKDNADIEIQIIGDGNKKDEFVSETERLGLTNIKFYPLQPVDMVSDVYSACSVALIPLMRGVIGNGVPSKAPILMACNRVIINSVEIDSVYAKMFIEKDMGISVDIEDYDALKDAVLDLYNSPEKIERMAVNAKNHSKLNYSSYASTKTLMEIFDGVKKQADV